MNHRAVMARIPILHLTVVDHIVFTAAVVPRMQLVPAIDGTFLERLIVILQATFVTVILPAGSDRTSRSAFFFGVAFETLLSAEIATVLKHVPRLWMESPK